MRAVCQKRTVVLPKFRARLALGQYSGFALVSTCYRVLSGFSGMLGLRDHPRTTRRGECELIIRMKRLLTTKSKKSRATAKRTLPHHVTNRYAATVLLTSLVFIPGFSSPPYYGQEPQLLSLAAHIPLPIVKGRIDHFSVDAKGHRGENRRSFQ